MTLELVAPGGDGASGGSACARARRAGRGARQHLLPHQRHREDASPARSADAEAGAGCRGRKPRCRDRRHAVVEADPRRDRIARAACGCFSSNWPRNARFRCEPRPASITAMDHVVIGTADPERAAALYGARLGLDMALDRSHPDWGRLMFFRCGDLDRRGGAPAGQGRRLPRRTGCAASAGASPTSTPPGRGWSRPASTSRRCGTGRKPGTRVMTVRNGTCGVPTLLVERTAKPADFAPLPLQGANERSDPVSHWPSDASRAHKASISTFILKPPCVLQATRAFDGRLIWQRQNAF